MADAALRAVDLARHARWIARTVRLPFAVCEAAGELLWPADAARLPAELGRALIEGAAANVQYKPLAPGTALLHVALPGADGPSGAVGLLLAEEPMAAELDEAVDALADVAASIAEEAGLRRELDGMAMELAQRYEELHLLYAADKRLEGCGPQTDVLQRVLEDSASHMNVDIAAFVSPRHGLALHATNLSQPVHNLDLVLVEMRGDLYRFVSASRQPIVLNDMTDARRAYIFTDMPYKLVACPVFESAIPAGALVMLNHLDKPHFTNADRNLCETLASQLSSLLHVVGLMQSMSRFTEQMAAALIETVEAKDPYTRGHSERVHRVAMEIGRALALPADELDDLHWGALLHDVGKIGIPDAVLCKPGRLTADEYTFIMVHPERSYEILRHVERLAGALPAARHHQEKFDGTGYPHGLKGKHIPLLARIIAVADTYDSITSSRAYRPGRSHEFALEEIARVSGTQLDPDIVDTFLALCAAEPEWVRDFHIRRETADA